MTVNLSVNVNLYLVLQSLSILNNCKDTVTEM